jgi:hypothetical protein
VFDIYSRKPCFTHNNIETSYQSFSFNFVTLYGRCSKIVCMFKLEVTWSISELSMYFKSHKNKSVHKRIPHFSDLFSNHIICSYLEELIELRRQWSIISDTKFRRQQKIAADNLIFGGIIGGNCLLPPKIARTDPHLSTTTGVVIGFHWMVHNTSKSEIDFFHRLKNLNINIPRYINKY